MNPKDIFKLAVRLLGLYFFYLALKDLDVPALMDVTIIKGDNLDDLVSTLLPVAFNLVIAWWLLRSAFLIRRAYPDAPRNAERANLRTEPAAPITKSRPAQPQELSEMETAEKKLAALVGKPKDDLGAK